MKKKKVNLRDLEPKKYQGEHSNDDGHKNSSPDKIFNFRTYLPSIFSLVMLIAGIAIDYFDAFPHFSGWIRILWYVIAYIPVGFPVVKEGWESIKTGDFFTEFFFNVYCYYWRICHW